MADVFHSIKKEKLLSYLRETFSEQFKGCKNIAIKIHFGEVGNKNTFRPEHIKPITDILQELGFNYFLYDSSVAYPGPRNLPLTHKAMALIKGWGKLGKIKTNDDFIESKGKNMTYEVCKELADADAVLVINHVKGHVCCGFGGAIKNLGMGALTKKSKKAIHSGAKPLEEGECIRCGKCVEACPVDGIQLKDDYKVPKIVSCFGCSNCGYVCPTGYMKTKLAGFDELLADGAAAAEKTFKKSFYISYMINIAKVCDCVPSTKPIISDDAGYLASSDGVAIDKAAIDIITQNNGENPFLKHNKKEGIRQINFAEEFGMGNKKYDLKEA